MHVDCLVFVLYTRRKPWSLPSKTYKSTHFLISVLFLIEVPCEDNPLGAAEGGKLPSSSFTGSSSYGEYAPSGGRLNGPMAWCAAEDSGRREYLEIHLPQAETICAIATQGTGFSGGNEHVKSYYLSYSEDGQRWQVLKQSGSTKVLVYLPCHILGALPRAKLSKTLNLIICVT